MENLLRVSELGLLRYFSSAILYPAPVAPDTDRNRSLVYLNSSFSSPSVIVALELSSSSSHPHAREYNRIRIERAKFYCVRRNERRPIRAWKARRQGEREGMSTSTNRLNDRATGGCYSRHLHLYGVSSEHCAVREGPQCVSSVTEIAGEWCRRSWLATEVARLVSTKPQTPSLNGRVTNYLGNNHPTIVPPTSRFANGEPTFRN